MGYFVPETLREKDNWIVWKLEQNSKGKFDKVPYNAKTGSKASTSDRRTWASYAQAVTMQKYGDFSGIGFVFSRADGLVFIDIDHCIEDGEETQLAKDIQARFPGSYAEISQSGNGLHIICKGVIPRGFNNREAGVEMYAWGRYVAFTGNATSDTEPQEAQASINALFEEYATREPQNAPQPIYKPRKRNQSRDDVLEIILDSRQGDKFAKLLTGDISGYSSQSEADQAFINIAHAFSGGSIETILYLWELSKLSDRPKGKRADYIDRMIKNAQRTYTGSRTRAAAERRVVLDIPQPKESYRRK